MINITEFHHHQGTIREKNKNILVLSYLTTNQSQNLIHIIQNVNSVKNSIPDMRILVNSTSKI